MATVFAHKLALVASLGIGVLDLAWLNLELAPQVLAREPVARTEAPTSALQTASDTPRVVPQVALRDPRPVQPAREPDAGAAAAAAAADDDQLRALVDAHETVYFATNRADIPARARARIARAVRDAAPGALFVLTGHADHRGEETFNHQLSQRRAEAVAAQLVRLGIARHQIEVAAVGEVPPGDDTELWRDRRVDIHVRGSTTEDAHMRGDR